MTPPPSRKAGFDPDGDPNSLEANALAQQIEDLIAREGPIGFDRFMALCLYSPAGYYARAPRIGRGGDFFTSVSVGPLFGHLLADRLAGWWRGHARPDCWRILEPGGHDGCLARDILEHLESEHPEAAAGVEYALVEPLEALAAKQRRTLDRQFAAGRARQVASADALDPLPGALVANEVVDALPFRIVESTGDGWNELGVGLDPGGRLAWSVLGPAGGEAVAVLPRRPAGYRTEVRTGLDGFLAPLARALSPGLMVWIDYGFDREDYYHEDRTEGTFRTFRNHRAGDDLLDSPGHCDITSHVDFTTLAAAISGCGGQPGAPEPQARYLTRVAEPWLRSLEGLRDPGTMALVRQFQTLTHPAQLGARFQVLEASLP